MPPEHDAIDAAYAARAAAKAGKRGHARERWSFFERMHADVDAPALAVAVAAALAEDQAAAEEPEPRRGAGPAPRAFPGANLNRWVPIGPTVTRRGQAMSRPRASGRIRDIAVSPDGRRAYAVSAKGGVWYSGDAGATWAPVGGWATRSVNPQGNGNLASGGALLVDFSGGLAALDVVLFGTGEPTPATTATGSSAQGGMGVLAALGPTFDPVDADPWERDTGAALLAGLGVWRLVRHPSANAFSPTPGPTQDRVLAATTNGLYLGTRSSLPHVAAAPPAAPGLPAQPELPVRDGFTWASCNAAPPLGSPNDVTDVVWLANGATTRIVYAVAGTGVFLSDDSGANGVPIVGLQFPGVRFMNRISLTVVAGTSRMYVLAEVRVAGVPTPLLFRIVDALASPPVVVPITGVPPNLFGDPTKPPTQGWYDHGLAAEAVGANDRIYLGGSAVYLHSGGEQDWGGSLYCFETPSPPAAVAPLTAVNGVSRRTNPPAGDGADISGLIGNNVHSDIHAIRLTGPAAPNRQVWVGCDGGVYVSEHSGRVNTFAARNNGLATLEPIFVASHPSSSHFLATGFQDNGTQVRVGDTVWEETFEGDGGGTVFHPIRSDIVVTQWTAASWNGSPASAYFDPITRLPGLAGTEVRENGTAAFYSGAAVVADTPTTGRVALGTNRVWITDNLGGTLPLRWRVLPNPPVTTEKDARNNGGVDLFPNFGVPNIVNNNFVANGVSTADQVIDMTWQSGSVLLVVYQGGLVRYTNTNKAAGTWTSQSWLLTGPIPLAPDAVMTAVASVPNSLDFYVATLGEPTDPTVDTLWFYDDANSVFRPTGLRRKLDFTGPPVVAGPLDPCYSVVVDPETPANPADPRDIYVGTATGVYKGRRTAPTTWAFDTFMNGLPDATVQDLDIWRQPAGGPKMLRAGVQSRGVWEVDLSQPETRRTYVRVHAHDDRRTLPTPLANPRQSPAATPLRVFASPDITVRPAWPVAAPPRFHSTIQSGALPVYDLWTFQTAFRWLYPSCVADGRWTDAMRDLVRFHRSVLGLSPGALIDQTMWRHVVGGTVSGVDRGVRLRPDAIFSENATVTADPADALAVYRAPWQTPLAFDLPATEIDLMESVLPLRNDAGEWTVFRERSTVDVLLHHRDSRPVPPPSAFAVVLWQSAPTRAALLALGAADLVAFLAGVRAAGIGGVPPALAGGWNVVTTAGGAAMQTLHTPLDARLPRAVSVDVDLSGVTSGHRVLVLALVGSLADDPVTAPVGAPVSVADLVQAWPHAALRVLRVTTRT